MKYDIMAQICIISSRIMLRRNSYNATNYTEMEIGMPVAWLIYTKYVIVGIIGLSCGIEY